MSEEKLGALNEYKLLGNSGLRVSPFCLGCMTFGEDWDFGSNSGESRKVFDLYRSKGGNFFDTANVYQNGTSERLLGEYISSCRSDCVVATKYTGNPKFMRVLKGKLEPGEMVNPNAGGNHRKSLIENLDESLKRLNVGYIDLLYVHAWEYQTPVTEVMRSLDDCVRSGKVLYLAISDAPAYVISQANTIADFRGWSPFIALQTRYNLIERSFEGDLARVSADQKLGVVPWGALAEGFLTGKHKKEEVNQESGRKDTVSRHLGNDKNMEILSEVLKVAEEVKKTPAQVSINWLTQKNTIPLIGARTVSQLEDNLAALDFRLSSEHMARLDKVSEPSLPFPYNFLGGAGPSRFTDAGLKVQKRAF